MADFTYIKNGITDKWVISAPKRNHRPNLDHVEPICPFCPGNEEDEVYRVGGKAPLLQGFVGQVGDSDWEIRVKKNIYPFAPIHEIVIHSQNHHKNIDELSFAQVELILQTYRHRTQFHEGKGQVIIFHNRGHAAGESQQHPHSQIAVIPSHLEIMTQPMDMHLYSNHHYRSWKDTESSGSTLQTDQFMLFCPQSSEWPDEVWIAPQKAAQRFSDVSDEQITDLAFVLARVIQIYDLRHGHEFPFNFYISPGKNWYLRLIPRIKTLGGFELATGVSVNTQDPEETMSFLKEHFWQPDREKIKLHQQAGYRKKV